MHETAMMKAPAPSKSVVVIVCPYSTGCCVAMEFQNRGYNLIRLWPRGFSDALKAHVPVSTEGKLQWSATEEEAESISATATLVKDIATRYHWDIAACVCGGEAGVDLADALSEELGLLSNGTSVANRRDKKVQQDLARAAGLRAVRQASGSTFADVKDFLETEPYPLIIKPLDSAGSDGVKLVHTYQEAKDYVHKLLGSPSINGGYCEELLCQEYLRGKEYVVDHVSRDGVHKTVMVWVYDKCAINGGDFVYQGDIPIDPESTEAKLLIPYARGILDAIGCRNGPSHTEIIMTADG